jgi:protein subunit release factor B
VKERKKVLSVTLADCDLSTFSVGGAGGQGRDHVNSGVQIRHRASGAIGRGTESRSQAQNKKAAWTRMAESVKFKLWMNQQLAKGPTIEEKIAADMQPENLLVEYGPFE